MSPKRRGSTNLSGIVLVDKPTGITSHDVVARVRRATGEGRIGHAGTLDPMATGLLVLLVGPAARLGPYLTAADKTYDATITFGSATDTDDAEGSVIATADVPDTLFDADLATETLSGFLGDQMQVPPTYSAIKTGGKAAHRVARGGGAVDATPRPVRVVEAELGSTESSTSSWHVTFRVSKGTYVRALARDIGRRVGTPAHLSALRRTASGDLAIEAAHALDEVVERAEARRLEQLFIDPVVALGNLRTLEADAGSVLAGRSIDIDATLEALARDQLVAVVVDGGGLGALYRVGDGRLVPEVVLSIPARGQR